MTFEKKWFDHNVSSYDWKKRLWLWLFADRHCHLDREEGVVIHYYKHRDIVYVRYIDFINEE